MSLIAKQWHLCWSMHQLFTWCSCECCNRYSPQEK